MVLCQLEIPMETIGHTLNLCAEVGVPVMLDPAPAAKLPEGLLSRIAWFTPNETEAAFYLPLLPDPESAAKNLLARGIKGVVFKRGAEGSFVAVKDGKAAWVSPIEVEAIDTVGAGDCFNGAFAVALLEGNHPWAAAHIASIAAAISVTRRGAQASMPTRADMQEFLAKRK
jgi:ribokinase